MSTASNRFTTFATAIATGLVAAIPPAFGHHFMEGNVPANGFEGLMSGLGHPVIGMDHLAFVLAVGLIAALRGAKGMIVPGMFVLATLVGTAVHLMGWTLPLAEAAVALSVIAAGAVLFVRAGQGSPRMLATFAGIAGVFHGYAYGESIVGAEPTPLVAYLAGFSIVQVAIGMAAYAAGVWIMNRKPGLLGQVMRIGGTAVSLLGLGFLVGAAA